MRCEKIAYTLTKNDQFSEINKNLNQYFDSNCNQYSKLKLHL